MQALPPLIESGRPLQALKSILKGGKGRKALPPLAGPETPYAGIQGLLKGILTCPAPDRIRGQALNAPEIDSEGGGSPDTTSPP